jgi:hypothetical protein
MAHDEICSFNALLKRWNQLWWGKYKPDDDEAKKLSNQAYIAMDKYYAMYLDREYEGAYTDFPYSVEVGPHLIVGTVPVLLTKGGKTELYYPMSQKTTMDLIRNVVVRADIVAITHATGNMPYRVSHSKYTTSTPEDPMKFDVFFPKRQWLNKATESLIMLISAIRDGLTWPNNHQCKLCELRNKCTG